MRLTIKLPTGTTELDATLDRLAQNVVKLTPFWEWVLARWTHLVSREFAQGGVLSGPWAPLSGRYGTWKRKHFPGRVTLVRTGELARSLYVRPDVYEVSDTGLRVGSLSPVGWYHMTGTPNMPARPPVPPLTEAERIAWIKVLQRFVITGKVQSALSTERYHLVGV